MSSFTIERHAETPVFQQIAGHLRRQIQEGQLRFGDVMPSERELSESFRVSRMTLRAALDQLVREGLLRRHQGRSTIVSYVRIHKRAQIVGFMSFTEEMRARGLTPSSKILEFRSEIADAAVAAQLLLPLGSYVIFLKRLRLANGEPMALERCYLPYERFSGIMHADLAACSLYDLLERDFDTRPTECEETVQAILLDAVDARELGVKRGSPGLIVQRVTRDQRGNLVETEQSLYRADRYRMVFVRQR